MLDVAMIGAGLAGIHGALALQAEGLRVELFDKSRGIGGRLATRRGNDYRFDHGLSSWQILGEYTEKLTPELMQAEILKPWRIARTDSHDPTTWRNLDMEEAWIAPEGMTAIAKYLAQDLTIHRAYQLKEISLETDHWQLSFENGEAIASKSLILALPLPQVITHIVSIITVRDRPPLANYESALSLMVAYDKLNLDFPWQELQLTSHPMFKKIIFDGQKRSPQTPTLVVQTHGTFTEPYLDVADLTPATEILINELKTLFSLPDPTWSQIHRWRYALPQQTLGQPCLTLETELPLIACGDWCLGHGIEGAIASGYAAALQLKQRLNPA